MGALMRADWGRNNQMAVPVSPSPDVQEPRVWVLGLGAHNIHTPPQAAAELSVLFGPMLGN
jgi:hypothetical protein